ncbi:MAG: hypothetical protein AB7P07_12805 [Hyphomonadaceae bacterium]
MKKLLIACAMITAFAAPAFADTMENGYGNTFVVTNAAGEVAHYMFDEGGTFSAMAGEQHVTGAWEVADGQLCITPEGGERGCTAYSGDKNVGDTWTQNGTDGSEISVTLQAGREHAH